MTSVRERTAVVRTVRRATAVVAVLGMLVLSSCGNNAPGVAAQVEGDQITDSQVDDFAQVLCELNSGAGSQGAGASATPTKQLRFQALQILMGNDLALDVIDPGSVDPEQVSAAVEQAAASRDALPSSLRGVFEDVVEEFATAQLGLTALGRESLQGAGEKKIDDQAALAEGDRLRTAYARNADVSVDPRFGTFSDGTLQPSDGSLSVAVSKAAVDGASPEGSGTDLPANLTCS